ncbi:HGGxSTG domain-containing protein [Stutzerimonas kunmingensis]|uniref:HGGxSTG domain-containing protein n=1 Tax=Stutzerimonas kunmingensis TaxID=1211807 RepID=UPI0028ADB8FA|nr:HGGxSTG domain-containing protein [Stutzerimonas kunmingensis]
MALCGAKTRSGEPCKRHAIPGSKRCKLHGGKSTGAPGNKNAAKPGSIYSKYLTDEELADFHAAEIDQIDQELRLTKVLLNRVLMAKADGYDLLADRYLARIESLTKTREELDTKRLTNEKLRRELEDPNQGLPEPKQVIIGVEDASDPEAE